MCGGVIASNHSGYSGGGFCDTSNAVGSAVGFTVNFAAVQNTSRNAGATGVFYWEPTWHAVPGNGWDPADIDNSGNGWENQAVFDRNGRINPDIRWLP